MSDAIKIDPEFQALIPAHAAEERAQLEANILADKNITDPLTTWKHHGLLIDGHTRKEIGDKHGIGYRVVELEFANRSAVIEWIIRHQFGRRNLTPMVRAELALKLEPVLAAKAAERKKSTLAEPGERVAAKVVPISAPPRKPAKNAKTVETVAAAAGVGKGTIQKVKKITEKATPALQQAARENRVSVNAAALAADLPAAEQDAIAAGGKSKEQPIDPRGQVVPDALSDAWAVRPLLDTLAGDIRSVKSRLAKMIPANSDTVKPGLAVLQTGRARITEALKLLEQFVTDSRPELVCVRCHGKGCVHCRTLGYVVHKDVDTHLRNAVADGVLTKEAADAAA